MRALIVDDSRFVRGFLRGLLEERGIECEEAADGQAGMDLLHGERALRSGAGGLEYAGDGWAGDAEATARGGIRRHESDDGDHRGGKRLHSSARWMPARTNT